MRVLLRDGYCVGTIFFFDDGRAFWWLDDSRIEIHDEAGNVLREISLPAEEERRAAAECGECPRSDSHQSDWNSAS